MAHHFAQALPCMDYLSVPMTLRVSLIQSIPPTASVIITTTQANQHGNDQRSSDISVKGQPLPLAFHVLVGPMQKVAEMTVTVSISPSILVLG